MQYTNNQCPVCGQPFTDGDDVVVCPDCGTPHHRACWNTLHHCANENRHASGYEWVNPAQSEPRHTHERDPRANDGASRVVRCPACGAENQRGSDRCVNCGEPLAHRFHTPNELFGGLNVNAVPPNVMIDGIPAEEEAAYIGPSATRYILRFLAMDQRESKAGWNWGGAIFGPIWMFYRKMYKEGVIYILCSLIIAMLCIPAGFTDFIQDFFRLSAQTQDMQTLMRFLMERMPGVTGWQYYLSYGFSLAVRILLAIFGDYLYRRKARRSILRLRTKADSMDGYMNLLRRKGGVSILMSVLFLLLYAYVQAAVTAGFAYLFHI